MFAHAVFEAMFDNAAVKNVIQIRSTKSGRFERPLKLFPIHESRVESLNPWLSAKPPENKNKIVHGIFDCTYSQSTRGTHFLSGSSSSGSSCSSPTTSSSSSDDDISRGV